MIDIDLTAWQHQLRLKKEAGNSYLYDPIREKWLVLQPEEVVRQLMILYLLEARGFNKNRIRVEQGLTVNRLSKRCDILVFDREVKPYLLVECKSPKVPVTQDVFDQIARYNMPLQVQFLVVTNGPVTFCSRMDYENSTYTFLPEIPVYP